MKVAVLTRDYPPRIGGVSTHVDALTRALRDLGVEADVFVGGNDVKTLLLPLDIPLKEYDIVHAQSAPYGGFVVGVPLVVTVHSPVLTEFAHYRRALKLEALPASAFERVSLSRARAILSVSEFTRDDLVRRYGVSPAKVSVIGNGVDFERFASGERERRPTRVLLVSRLEPRKFVEEAIEAVSELPLGSYELQVAGDGSQRSSLEALAKSLGVEARFLGSVGADDLPLLYSEAAIFLTTSVSEGFGLSLLEAMASGCAPVVSDIPSHRALIRNGVNGLIYRDRAELVSDLRELLTSARAARSLGAAAQESAREHSWKRVASRVIEAYNRCLEPRRT